MKTTKLPSLLLSEVGEGKKILIKDIRDDVVKNHLSKLGIFVNHEVVVSKTDLFKHLISIRTDEAEIAIRKEVADKIEVEVFA